MKTTYHGNIGDINNRRSNKFLEINHCGISNYKLGDYTTIREQGRLDYQLIYIRKGKIYVQFGEETIPVSAGNAILYRPGDPQKYSYLKKDKYESVYVHFSGERANEILSELEIDNRRIFSILATDEMDLLADKLLPEHRLSKKGYKILESSILLNMLCLISRGNEENAELTTTKQKIEKIIIKMESNITNNFTVKDYADELFLSVDRFSHLFTETVGIPPHRYMLTLKMNRAKQLLIQTDNSISEIAKFIGFADPLYFSRIFKKHCGSTPMQFRKSAKQNTPSQIPLSLDK